MVFFYRMAATINGHYTVYNVLINLRWALPKFCFVQPMTAKLKGRPITSSGGFQALHRNQQIDSIQYQKSHQSEQTQSNYCKHNGENY